MVGLTDYSAQAVLNWRTGKASMPAATARYLALFTAVGADAGTGFTEVSGGSYARQQVPAASWNSAGGSAPSSASNSAPIAFPTSTADWTGGGASPVIAWGLFDDPAAGNLLEWDYLGNGLWVPFSCTAASPGVLTAPAHGFTNGDKAAVTAEFGGALPATAGSWAGLLTVAGATADTFNLGIAATGTGSGSVRKVASQLVPNNVTVSFAAGSLILQAA